jgi:hypothetical protein
VRTALPAAAQARVEHAVLRMLGADERLQPFVILEHEPTECFVQFCGSASLELVFDVPALSITEKLGRPTELGAIVARAYEVLEHLVARHRASYGLTTAPIAMSDELVLEESLESPGAAA